MFCRSPAEFAEEAFSNDKLHVQPPRGWPFTPLTVMMPRQLLAAPLLWQLTLTLSHHNSTWSLFAGHVLHQFPNGQGRIRGIAEKPSGANTGRLVAGGCASRPAAGGRASVGPRVLTDMGILTGHLVVLAAVSG